MELLRAFYDLAHEPLALTLCFSGIAGHCFCIAVLSKMLNATNLLLISMSWWVSELRERMYIIVNCLAPKRAAGLSRKLTTFCLPFPFQKPVWQLNCSPVFGM